MATASFYKFTLLPSEIQQQIWMLATESTPGAHFFTYIDPDDKFESTPRDRRIRRTAHHSPYGPDLALVVPADDRSIIRPPKQKNKDDFVLGTYRDEGVTRNVTVRSGTDLIILCPADLGDLSWDRVRAECPPRVRHLALEYDPSWPQFGQGTPPRSEKGKAACERLAWLTAELCYWPQLVWFIDYSLRRRPDAEGYMDDVRYEFWCGTGRFVQVWDDDEDWFTGPEDGVHMLVASFKEDRETRLRLKEDLEEMGIDVPARGVKIPLEPDPDDRFLGPRPGPIFGVLAFEPW